MTIQAVAALQTICRSEFERDWNGFEDEPLTFIEGDPYSEPPTPPIKEITVELGGKVYVFPSADVVAIIEYSQEIARSEAEEEIEEIDEDVRYDYRFDYDEVLAEKTEAKLHEFWSSQLDGEEEVLAVIEHRLHYVVEGFKELVAYFNMIGERIPELRPVLAEKLQAAHDEMVAQLQGFITG